MYTDGACSNNGKNNAKAGYGIYTGTKVYAGKLMPFQFELVNGSLKATDIPAQLTNNRAEMFAVILAIHKFKAKKIITDSTYVINSVGSMYRWFEKNDAADKKNRDLLRILLKISIGVEYIYQRGHQKMTGNIHIFGNNLADKAAVKGINLPDYEVHLLMDLSNSPSLSSSSSSSSSES